MKKSHRHSTCAIPYLQVVQGNTPPDFNPPRPAGISERDWFIFLHGEEIRAGAYDYWVLHGGSCMSDKTLKAQGLIPQDWAFRDGRQTLIRPLDAEPLVPTTDSTSPEVLS